MVKIAFYKDSAATLLVFIVKTVFYKDVAATLLWFNIKIAFFKNILELLQSDLMLIYIYK